MFMTELELFTIAKYGNNPNDCLQMDGFAKCISTPCNII